MSPRVMHARCMLGSLLLTACLLKPWRMTCDRPSGSQVVMSWSCRRKKHRERTCELGQVGVSSMGDNVNGD